jgi:hypothetical protein
LEAGPWKRSWRLKMQLSPNFTLDELTRSEAAARNGWDNTPNEAEIENLKAPCGPAPRGQGSGRGQAGDDQLWVLGPNWSTMRWVLKTLASTAWAAQPTCGCLG